MRIGIDFDNTIACYDGVFHAAALERGLIGAGVATTKNAVRDDMEGRGLKDAFTELQGHVYGARMNLARPYPGALDFVRAARAAGHEIAIVSHKTRLPLMGPPHDLHEAALGFLAAQGFFGDGLIDMARAFFEETMEAKVARAAALGVDAFIDDLPKVLAMPGFPHGTRKILFAPLGEDGTPGPVDARFERHETWTGIHRGLLG